MINKAEQMKEKHNRTGQSRRTNYVERYKTDSDSNGM